MTFHEFLISKFPLYDDPNIKVNLTVDELVKLHDEYLTYVETQFKSAYAKIKSFFKTTENET